MATPKKKTSKSRSRMRYAVWSRKAVLQAQKAMSLGRSILSQRNTGFYYPTEEAEESEE
jgi:large subunit ribosomal protein L32